MYKASIHNKTYQVDVKDGGVFTVDGRPFQIKLLGDTYVFLINNRKVQVEAGQTEKGGHRHELWISGRKYPVSLKNPLEQLLEKMGMNSVASQTVKELKAPMPGLVLDIIATKGQAVDKDDSLLILEAMKMENVIKSPGTGIVKEIKVEKGTAVEKNDILITFE